jgi:ribonuclease E
LSETTSKLCPRCLGHGTIRGTRSLSLSILRLVEEEAQKENSAEIRTIVPVSVGTFLLNEKRKEIFDIEKRYTAKIVVIPKENLTTPHFEVQRIRVQDDVNSEYSYKLTGTMTPELIPSEAEEVQPVPPAHVPAVKNIAPPNFPSQSKKSGNEDKISFISLIFQKFFGTTDKSNQEAERKGPERRPQRRPNNRGRRSDNRNRGRSHKNNIDSRSQGTDIENKIQDISTEKTSKVVTNTSESGSMSKHRPPRREGEKRRAPRPRRERQDVPDELLENTDVVKKIPIAEKPLAKDQPELTDLKTDDVEIKPSKPKAKKKTSKKEQIESSPKDILLKTDEDGSNQEESKKITSEAVTKKKPTKKTESTKKLKGELKAASEKDTKKITKLTKTRSRASNDPRKKPKPVKDVKIETVVIEVSEAKPLDTSDLSIMSGISKKVARPANDPRGEK